MVRLPSNPVTYPLPSLLPAFPSSFPPSSLSLALPSFFLFLKTNCKPSSRSWGGTQGSMRAGPAPPPRSWLAFSFSSKAFCLWLPSSARGCCTQVEGNIDGHRPWMSSRKKLGAGSSLVLPGKWLCPSRKVPQPVTLWSGPMRGTEVEVADGALLRRPGGWVGPRLGGKEGCRWPGGTFWA